MFCDKRANAGSANVISIVDGAGDKVVLENRCDELAARGRRQAQVTESLHAGLSRTAPRHCNPDCGVLGARESVAGYDPAYETDAPTDRQTDGRTGSRMS